MKPKQAGSVANQAVNNKVFAGQVEFLYRQLRAGLYASMAVGILLVMALWTQTPRQHLLIWLGFLITVAISRLFLLSMFSRNAPKSDAMHHWLKYFTLGTAAMGCVVGGRVLHSSACGIARLYGSDAVCPGRCNGSRISVAIRNRHSICSIPCANRTSDKRQTVYAG